MNNRILIVHKGRFDQFPPLISVKCALNNLGFSVDVMTTEIERTNLIARDEKVIIIPKSKIPIIGIFVWYLRFLYKFKYISRRNYDYVWIEGGDTLALFGIFLNIHPKSKFIIQISELYDSWPMYKFLIGLSIKKFNKIVVPEINRAFIFKVWYKLKSLPYLLPNKPNYNISNELAIKDVFTDNLLSQVKSFAKKRKIILYQGLIASDRKFAGVINFIAKNEDFCLVLLGKDLGYLDEITHDQENVFYAGFLSPPLHLEVTKLSHICLMAYDSTSLNKIYCAPNKIWEYAQYGKPIISQKLPGIESTFLRFKFGECCDLNEYLNVKNSILKIEANYSEYSRNALKFYKGFEFEEAIKDILS